MKDCIIRILLLICGLQPAFGQADRIHQLQQSLRLIKDSTHYVDVINKIAILSYERAADSTLYYASHAKQIAGRLKYAKGLADAANNLGIAFDVRGNLQLSLRYYNDAYNQYVTLGDTSNIIQTLMNIASVYAISGKDDKAVANFDRALLLGSLASQDSITSMAAYNYLLFYPQKFTRQRKATLVAKINAAAEKYHDPRLWVAGQQLGGDDLIADNQKEKGLQQLESALDSALKMQLYYLSIDLLMDLGNHYFAVSPEKGLSFYKRALEIAEDKKYQMYAKDICEKLYGIYLKKDDTRTAFMYSQRLVGIYEELAELDRISGIDYIEYAIKDQQLESERLKSAYSSRLLWLVIIVCILAVLSVIFLGRNWQLTRKTNELLTLQFRQLESTSLSLEKSNQNYAGLIKIVAHDLRSPIGGIYMMSIMLQDDSLPEEEVEEVVSLIHSASNSCLKLISDLLQSDFHVSEAELQYESIPLSKFLQQTVKLLTFKANEKHQTLLLDEPVSASLMADRDKLLRVFNNLIGNAIKFSAEGATIRIDTEPTEQGVIISIEDHGMGIPKAAAAKLFDPFTPFKRDGTAGERPFGLGLYISKQIVEAHRGKIWYESEEGKGATFFVFLPWTHPLS